LADSDLGDELVDVHATRLAAPSLALLVHRRDLRDRAPHVRNAMGRTEPTFPVTGSASHGVDAASSSPIDRNGTVDLRSVARPA